MRPTLLSLTILLSILTQNLYANSSMKEMLEYLASDALEGRKPGQIGNELATSYIEKKLVDMGLAPLGKSHKQDFTIFTEMTKSGTNNLSISGQKISSYEPISFSLSGDLKNKELVFVGYGISISKNDTKIKYDDYENIDVKNKIVIFMSGDPAIGNINSPFRHPDYISYRSLFYKLKNAIGHGAVGAIYINDPMSIPGYPAEDEPYFNATEGGGNRFSIVVGRTTNAAIKRSIPSLDIYKIQKKIAKTGIPYSFSLKKTADLSVNLKKKTGRVSNIVGVIEGSDPVLKKEVVVLGAHMDHLGHGGESSTDPIPDGKIHNGADDNASGTVLVMSLANKIKKMNPKRTYVFVLFNAEEMGLLGSTHFVNMWAAHTEQYGEIVSMLNYDMVGRYDKELSVMGVGSSKEWSRLFPATPSTHNFVLKKNALESSDHAPFIRAKIPSLFFTTGAHGDYHSSTDTAEKINYQPMLTLQDYSIKLIKQMEANSRIVFDNSYSSGTTTGTRGYGAHLGCIPSFGQSDDIVGVLCTGTSPNSPAQAAGILADDIIVQIGEVEIKSIYDLAFALKYYRAGDKIELGWMRGQTLFKQVITLARSRRQ